MVLLQLQFANLVWLNVAEIEIEDQTSGRATKNIYLASWSGPCPQATGWFPASTAQMGKQNPWDHHIFGGTAGTRKKIWWFVDVFFSFSKGFFVKFSVKNVEE